MVNILDFIPYGHGSAVTRAYLCAVTGLEDRAMRDLIKAAQDNGAMIANVGKGYFRFKDEADIPYFDRYYRSEDRKGWSIINKNRPKKRILERYKKGVAAPPTISTYHQTDMFEYMRKEG